MQWRLVQQSQAFVQGRQQVMDRELALGQDQAVFGASGEIHAAAVGQGMLGTDQRPQAKVTDAQLTNLRRPGQGERQAQVGAVIDQRQGIACEPCTVTPIVT